MQRTQVQRTACDATNSSDKGMTQVGAQHVGKQGRRADRCACTRILRLSLQPGRGRRRRCGNEHLIGNCLLTTTEYTMAWSRDASGQTLPSAPRNSMRRKNGGRGTCFFFFSLAESLVEDWRYGPHYARGHLKCRVHFSPPQRVRYLELNECLRTAVDKTWQPIP